MNTRFGYSLCGAVLVAVAALCVANVAFARPHNAVLNYVQTAKDTTDRWAPQPPLSLIPDFHFPNELAIDSSVQRQTFVGFGGAFTDAASTLFYQLNDNLQEEVLDLYFSPQGMRYRLGRLTINSCDFSIASYNYDNVTDDYNLDHFDISHDLTHIIPFIRRAMAKTADNYLQLVSTPWSPPGWMKDNGHMICPDGCGSCHLREEAKPSWALFFSKYLSAYQSAGVPVWGVTVQNEPEYCPKRYEGMNFTPEMERDFVRDFLGPVLRRDHPNTKILIYDHNKDDVVNWVTTVYADAKAADYVYGTAVHWYSGDQFDNLNTSHFLHPDKPILATEATAVREADPLHPLWEHGEHYAHDIMGDFNNWVIGFIDWNLMLDMLGGPNHQTPEECEGTDLCGSDSMLLVNITSQTIYPQVFYYYVGHFSKYIDVGATWISNTFTTDNPKALGIEATSFRNPDGKIVVVVMNTNDSPVMYKLRLVKSNMSTMVQIPPHSIQTFTTFE